MTRCGPVATASPRSASSSWRPSPSWSTPLPEEIFADIHQTARGVNVSTVYRTLELLEQLGLVTHTHLGHGAPRYHLAAEAQHVHLVCRDCEKVIQVDPAAVSGLVTALDADFGFETDVGHLTVFGHCADCRKDIQR